MLNLHLVAVYRDIQYKVERVVDQGEGGYY